MHFTLSGGQAGGRLGVKSKSCDRQNGEVPCSASPGLYSLYKLLPLLRRNFFFSQKFSRLLSFAGQSRHADKQ